MVEWGDADIVAQQSEGAESVVVETEGLHAHTGLWEFVKGAVRI